MRFFERAKDGGPESPVDGFFVVEIKKLFSIVLLRFNDGAREAYHSHAFNARSWLLKGTLEEQRLHRSNGEAVGVGIYNYNWLRHKRTSRDCMHRVRSYGTSWVLTIRGPWKDTWQEYDESTGNTITLTHGRKIVSA